MKREILCENCAKKLRKKLSGDDPYPGEHVKFVRGILERNCCCDFCMTNLNPGNPAYAMSIWTDRRDDYYPWESEFLKDEDPDPKTTL
jgi:hypothetical protein